MLSIIQKAYGELSEKEKQAIYWGYKLIGTELSKFIILLIIFIIIGKWGEFLISIAMLLPLRCNIGGLHFKTYRTCLLVTFSIFIVAIIILPKFILTKVKVILLMFLCLILTLIIGPIINPTRPSLSKFQIKKSKKRAAIIFVIYTILYCIFPDNQYIICGIWITIEQTIQLLLAKIQRRYLT